MRPRFWMSYQFLHVRSSWLRTLLTSLLLSSGNPSPVFVVLSEDERFLLRVETSVKDGLG